MFSKQGPAIGSDQVAQVVLENLQGLKLNNLSGQSVPLLGSHGEKVSSHTQCERLLFQLMTLFSSSYPPGTTVKSPAPSP